MSGRVKFRNPKWEFSITVDGSPRIDGPAGAVYVSKITFTQWPEKAKITCFGKTTRGSTYGQARTVSYYLGGYQNVDDPSRPMVLPPDWIIEMIRAADFRRVEV